MSAYLEDPDVTIHHGDALETLRELETDSVHMAATSPPFWALRDYSVAGQIGLEETPDEWAASLVEVFREVRRVLRKNGTCWIECGDSYAANSRTGTQDKRADLPDAWAGQTNSAVTHPTKPKDLVGAPWLLAFALRSDGWYLRQTIIWHKPNAMPESATDRPTTAHSYVFLLTREPHYYFDQDAIREPYGDAKAGQMFRGSDYKDHVHEPKGAAGPDGRAATARPAHKDTHASHENHDSRDGGERWPNPVGRNARSVWTIATQPYHGDHYATWPEALVTRMIKAGTSEHGVCGECGAPWEREVEQEPSSKPVYSKPRGYTIGGGSRDTITRLGDGVITTTTGWAPTCECGTTDLVPATILDPFAGAGTTMLAARKLGRHAIGIDLNPDYCQQASQRLQQLSLLT